MWELHEKPVNREKVTDKIHFCRLTIEWRNVRVAKPYEHPNGGNFTFQGPDLINYFPTMAHGFWYVVW